MDRRAPQTIDMNPDGSFAAPPPRAGLPWSARIALAAFAVSFVTGLVAVAALALYIAAILIPVMILAGIGGYLGLKWQAWRQANASGRQGAWPPAPPLGR